MQLVSYRSSDDTEKRWRAGIEHEGSVVDVATIWHENGQATTVKE